MERARSVGRAEHPILGKWAVIAAELLSLHLQAHQRFAAFGEVIEILVSSEASKGSVSVLTQTSPPSGGPPPYRHTHEDEMSMVLNGDFEFSTVRIGSRSVWAGGFSRREGVYTLFGISGPIMARRLCSLRPADSKGIWSNSVRCRFRPIRTRSAHYLSDLESSSLPK